MISAASAATKTAATMIAIGGFCFIVSLLLRSGTVRRPGRRSRTTLDDSTAGPPAAHGVNTSSGPFERIETRVATTFRKLQWAHSARAYRDADARDDGVTRFGELVHDVHRQPGLVPGLELRSEAGS